MKKGKKQRNVLQSSEENKYALFVGYVLLHFLVVHLPIMVLVPSYYHDRSLHIIIVFLINIPSTVHVFYNLIFSIHDTVTYEPVVQSVVQSMSYNFNEISEILKRQKSKRTLPSDLT